MTCNLRNANSSLRTVPTEETVTTLHSSRTSWGKRVDNDMQFTDRKLLLTDCTNFTDRKDIATVVTWSHNWPLTSGREHSTRGWKTTMLKHVAFMSTVLLPIRTQHGIRSWIVLVAYSCWDQTSRRNGLNRRIDPSNRTRFLHTWFQTRWRKVCHSPDRRYR